MANRKNLVILTSLLVLAAFVMSACLKTYSTVVPEGSPTPIDGDSLFVSPVATTDNAMGIVAEFATGSAIAGTSVALTQGTPPAEPVATDTPSGVEITPETATTEAPALACTQPACAEGQVLRCPQGQDCTNGCGYVCRDKPATDTPVPPPVGGQSCGSSYTLQPGEFPYCIARRCNVDPDELLAKNNLSSGNIYYANMTLLIPQGSKPFPDGRALRPHPATFVVGSTSSADSLYAVACYYGDVDPNSIAQANGISVSAPLTAGQQLNIP